MYCAFDMFKIHKIELEHQFDRRLRLLGQIGVVNTTEDMMNWSIE